MINLIKKQIVKRSMSKKKKANPFDINVADNYQLESDATGDINNSHYFTVHDFNSLECLYYRSALRGGNTPDEVWLVYRDKNGVVYINEHEHVTSQNPTRVECVTPGKLLKFYYDGYVYPAISEGKVFKRDTTKEKVRCQLSGEFSGISKIFEFTNDMNSNVMASAIAKEKLNREFQNAFNQIYQVHYEQGGFSTVEIVLDGKIQVINNKPAMRDHSFGKRKWDFFDRYVWTIILLENGELLHSSFMRYPVLKELQAGFKINGLQYVGIKKATNLDDIEAIGTCPDEFKLVVTYNDKTVSNITGTLDFVVPFYFEGDFNVNEGICEYDVNGKRGRGIGEFAFNKDKSRWTR